MEIEERQAFAAAIAAIGLLIAVPVLTGLGLLFVAGWLWILGVPGGHGMLFGWLSTKRYDGLGHPVWGVSRLVGSYFFGVVSLYIAYQLVELLSGAFRVFKDALT